MFDSHFRTLFLSTPAKLSHKNEHLVIAQKDSIGNEIKSSIPLADILCIILESNQITLSSSLLDKLATQKIILFSCDSTHLPSGVFTPFLGHYKTLSIMQTQVSLSKQKKSILWQKIIKQKLYNQALLLELHNKHKETKNILQLEKSVTLNDSNNNEAQAAMIYFPALFFKSFRRRLDSQESNVINAALNYGYAIVRGMIARSICASGLNAAFGIFHCNQFNAFNLVDDIIEPYRIFVDSMVAQMYHSKMLDNTFIKEHRVMLANILNTSILLSNNKLYPMYRAITLSVQSIVNSMQNDIKLELPIFNKDISNGREVYESPSDV